ncbi:hypothetical protein R5H30_02145 [Sulfitobacter sp. D35]|uniref:hypothetical protein n=1 Tax=Sulfitobacter sp. D35 TaxID=3083252 RepID=UPI00296F42D8|nr:hypothetical protein [Sulfitobacter sp. D35]MDW4496766.1 hypothetical protein [Sulfitobacter sp. D35]
MSELELEELQRRITGALDRVAGGIERLGGPDDGRIAELEQALADEQTANAQLEERLKVIGERQQTALAEMEERATAAEARIGTLDLDIQRLRQANAELAEACETLRVANAEGVGDPDLINRTVIAELDAMRAARAVDLAEVQQIIAAMTPLLDDAEFEEETA